MARHEQWQGISRVLKRAAVRAALGAAVLLVCAVLHGCRESGSSGPDWEPPTDESMPMGFDATE